MPVNKRGTRSSHANQRRQLKSTLRNLQRDGAARGDIVTAHTENSIKGAAWRELQEDIVLFEDEIQQQLDRVSELQQTRQGPTPEREEEINRRLQLADELLKERLDQEDRVDEFKAQRRLLISTCEQEEAELQPENGLDYTDDEYRFGLAYSFSLLIDWEGSGRLPPQEVSYLWHNAELAYDIHSEISVLANPYLVTCKVILVVIHLGLAIVIVLFFKFHRPPIILPAPSSQSTSLVNNKQESLTAYVTPGASDATLAQYVYEEIEIVEIFDETIVEDTAKTPIKSEINQVALKQETPKPETNQVSLKQEDPPQLPTPYDSIAARSHPISILRAAAILLEHDLRNTYGLHRKATVVLETVKNQRSRQGYRTAARRKTTTPEDLLNACNLISR
ncbi:hypothetical protein BJ508DRAFT_303416 [Ascobolus immersus RN42]|uniref:Uncharacterized protein n=1 Tax=Ascobolus immersus RN42 TaxID=1160509 RepID=A0A3N4ILM0_ASCIM|nr:hypothetical protein BJ508DRAFT_303416 [Ascobolus immersus RN42]